MNWCGMCKVSKSESEFNKRRKIGTLLQARCKACVRVYNHARWIVTDREKRNLHRRRTGMDKNYYIINTKKCSAASIKWRKENSDKAAIIMRRHDLKRNYGITADVYVDMLLAQGGVCAICKMPETAIMHGKVKHLSVDHDHKSKRVRSLLCQKCNTLIGLAMENKEVLMAAVKYVEQHEAGVECRS